MASASQVAGKLRAPYPPQPPAAALSPAQYVSWAEKGIAGQSRRWATSQDGGWYCERLGCTGAYPLLTAWGVARMLEAEDAVALAAPTAAHRAAVSRLAGQCETLYWNHYVNGFAAYPHDDYPPAPVFFDDEGWLGLGFYDAWRATRQSRWLSDAQKAFSFIAAHVWDGNNGPWWNVMHTDHSGEALAADSLLGALLNSTTHNGHDLVETRKWIDWANSKDIGGGGLYTTISNGRAIISYIQGPLVYAQYLVCQATGQQHYCDQAATIANRMNSRWGTYAYNFLPLYDSIALQWMMAYGKATHDTTWLTVAENSASEAMASASNGQGLWLNYWSGGAIHDPQVQPNMFRIMASTTSLFAWLAYYS